MEFLQLILYLICAQRTDSGYIMSCNVLAKEIKANFNLFDFLFEFCCVLSPVDNFSVMSECLPGLNQNKAVC